MIPEALQQFRNQKQLFCRKLRFHVKYFGEIVIETSSLELLGHGKREQWMPLRMELEQISDSWHTLAIKSLGCISKRFGHYLGDLFFFILCYLHSFLFNLFDLFFVKRPS